MFNVLVGEKRNFILQKYKLGRSFWELISQDEFQSITKTLMNQLYIVNPRSVGT